ncbi:hypothetical protein AMTRI_Chr12g235200 [Amborella trichopoda]|uniref:Uncharacterized protein n=1 Tax=Amborella trichopoda TaxID=13333 RepID=U5D4V5_AMBTC|nr:uncharacterized protein LOC18445589 [Amborella trichopoda]ERN17255.1 hypothetical protein AMTR_s00044p00212310 [Amborella trichopoda]|eukprot:XP_020529943.1 uncharacterized protein LOC18445589 [Amborella trichopoda]
MGSSADDASHQLSMAFPRVLIVSRRTVRKNKFVDFVGEYHLDLIVNYGAVPVIVPRVSGVQSLLESFEPIHGVLLCEGEDIDPSHYEMIDGPDTPALSVDELQHVQFLHSSDTAIDHEKDSIELRLARLCVERNVPYLGICRGSQVLNVACGGTLYQDVEKELAKKGAPDVRHMDYDHYDDHRHDVKVVPNTPLHEWFKESLGEGMEMRVNSYHHQGVRRLADRFVPMAYAPDGLVEAFYDPVAHKEGHFIMGLQFHPERMRSEFGNGEFDYPGCAKAYQEFVKAVIAYEKNASNGTVPRPLRLDGEMEKKRKKIVRSFSLARNLYAARNGVRSDLEAGAQFLESSVMLSLQQEKRLKQMGATVRNSSCFVERMKKMKEIENAARELLGKMSIDQLSELLTFYHMMANISSELFEKKHITM